MKTKIDEIAAKLMGHAGEQWDGADEERQNHFRDVAQDCLSPLMYPDEEMILAGSKVSEEYPPGTRAHNVFTMMMKAAFD